MHTNSTRQSRSEYQANLALQSGPRYYPQGRLTSASPRTLRAALLGSLGTLLKVLVETACILGGVALFLHVWIK